MPNLRACLLLASLGLLAGCGRGPAPAPVEAVQTQTVASPEEGGAVSRAPMTTPPAAPAPVPLPPTAKVADWSPIELASGQAWIDCRLDYREGDGEAVEAPSRANLRHLLEPCRDGDVVRLRYRGKIASDFTALVERVTRVADSLGIDSRVLDLDSTGGQVEDAIRAGDWIGGNRWTIWVREDSVCHSACVFVLAGGDSRRLAGRVGIHRIIRLSSTATSRTELNTELQAVYGTVREYLERNGASPLLADVMKTVPNRSLRLLTGDELALYGLDGNNAAQDDLDRVRLLDKCGDDFMRRRDAWVRAFDERCRAQQGEVHALNACGLQLRRDFGFPDDDCPAESPLAEFNELPEVLELPQAAEAAAGAQAAARATGQGDEAQSAGEPAAPRPPEGG
ncbi:COG3904 family protein [Pseudoxanthomonas sp. 10H]|uniref:COG3904 family protein n=1 Tax=Pseudoxanthomonas sp. 10H TaxID=3242729 RepID=UPI003558BA4D